LLKLSYMTEAQIYTDLLLTNRSDSKLSSVKEPKALLLALAFLCICVSLKSQVNLVPNPSFETLFGYDTSLFFDYIFKAPPWDTLKAGGGGGIVAPTPTTPMGYQKARTGNFMAGTSFYHSVSTNLKWRGYIQTPLTQKLKTNKPYCVTGYFNLQDRCQYAIDELSFYFDDGSIAAIAPREIAFAAPQVKSPSGIFYGDTMNWEKAQGVFVANGNENYVTIGNFKPQASLTASLVHPSVIGIVAEYFIDDVSVIDADLPACAGKDTIICIGDSVFIGRPPEIGLECSWRTGTINLGTGGGLWVKPVTTRTFEVTQDVCGLIKKDTILVQVKPKFIGAPVILTSSSPTACPSNTLTLSLFNNPPGTNSYSWLPPGVYSQTSNINAKASINQNALFTVNIFNSGQNSFCPFQRTASVSVSVPVFTDSPTLISNFNPVCPGDTIALSFVNPAPGNTVTYQWLPTTAYSSTTNLSAKTIAQLGSTYSLNVMSTGNSSICAYTRSLSISVSVADTCFKDPIIPNIFTPNNDNSNDLWSIKFPFGYTLKDLFIYDRWGILIYRRENLNFNKQGYALIGWDGRNTSGEEMSAGVYFYVLQYTDQQGVKKSEKGNITLLR